ncbi:hypothetical protein QYE76_009402 [Lolium multiflorum]|uniref:Reverse transcriptase Ty1/copia-type domain-containing protein n=1 Tax=Lolium multiflorum TaxID=4521 RepID=A0AAD8X209_LOLMU|nr:hypothetical protein QYE76_009402 [Lolium multiflorum]
MGLRRAVPPRACRPAPASNIGLAIWRFARRAAAVPACVCSTHARVLCQPATWRPVCSARTVPAAVSDSAWPTHATGQSCLAIWRCQRCSLCLFCHRIWGCLWIFCGCSQGEIIIAAPPAEPRTRLQKGEPCTLVEALNDPNWRQAMQDEYDALIDNKTWHLVPPSKSRNLIDCKWVYRIKKKADGTIDREDASERRDLRSNAFKKVSDTEATPLLDPTRVKVFTLRHPTMMGAKPRLYEDASKEGNGAQERHRQRLRIDRPRLSPKPSALTPINHTGKGSGDYIALRERPL